MYPTLFQNTMPIFYIDPEEYYNIGDIYIDKVTYQCRVLMSKDGENCYWRAFRLKYKDDGCFDWEYIPGLDILSPFVKFEDRKCNDNRKSSSPRESIK